MEDQLLKCRICKKSDTNALDFGPCIRKAVFMPFIIFVRLVIEVPELWNFKVFTFFIYTLSDDLSLLANNYQKKNSRQKKEMDERGILGFLKTLARCHTRTRCFYCKLSNVDYGFQYKCLFMFEKISLNHRRLFLHSTWWIVSEHFRLGIGILCILF